VERGATIVIASRYAQGAETLGYSAPRRLASRVGNALYRLAARLDGVSDYTNGYRAYPAAFLAEVRRGRGGRLFEARDFSAATELLLNLADRPGARVRELPFTYRYDRKSGASKLRLRATARRHLSLLARRLRVKTLRAESAG
jgi:dolichol-phosphate mannosyltransferase